MGKWFNSATWNSGFREIFLQIFYWSKKIHSLLCRFYVKSRRTSAILRVFKIFQSWQNIKFSNYCHGQTIQLSYMKLRIQRDICPNISRFIMEIFRKTSAILCVCKIFQSWQNIKFSNCCHKQRVQLSYMNLRIQRDIYPNILQVRKNCRFFTFWKFTKLYSTLTFHMSYKIAPIPWLVVILISWVLTSVMIWLYMF